MLVYITMSECQKNKNILLYIVYVPEAFSKLNLLSETSGLKNRLQTVSMKPPLPAPAPLALLPPRRFSRINDVSFEPTASPSAPLAVPSFGLSSVTVAELVIELLLGLTGPPPLVLVLALLTECLGVVAVLADVEGVFGVPAADTFGVLFGAIVDRTTPTPALVD